ncbi:hypothetical protein [Thermofilum pendens]|uniref:Uncharacterized protein n=1 Tax=Thermofilum pendens (strain DSM 2475 / Hrk 5) TaxID=368408 RepID=A1RZK7_THEPD|nr:hypothetical protein [Thermofilum pendens]ABL78637.1 protein of unknown function DUF125, transmembrane [Thermofilum pendens Hrk 5]
MSFEVQDLYDVIKISILLALEDDPRLRLDELESRLRELYGNEVGLDPAEIRKALSELSGEGLVVCKDGVLELTEAGLKISEDWRNLLLKSEPVLEVVAGLTDGTVTGLITVISSHLAGLSSKLTVFASLLALTSVAVTNFSSFFLGGVTEDLSEVVALRRLMAYSLSDHPDKRQVSRSLKLLGRLYRVLYREIRRANVLSAALSGVATLAAGFVPIALYLALPPPFNLLASIAVVSAAILALAKYRSSAARTHFKRTLAETLLVILLVVLVSLLLGLNA